MKKKHKLETIRFWDNKARFIDLPANWTMKELVKRGIKFRMDPIGTPLPDHWFAHPKSGQPEGGRE